MAYSEKVIDHYENPRNVGKMDVGDVNVGTGMVGAPACGDVMKLQIMVKDGKITAESRYQTAYILSQYIDVLVCHQILNPLNYLYLDAAFMGYPVLHNAPLCKDLGYYYESSDTVDGAKQLDYI